MKLIAAVVITSLLPSLALAQPLPQSKPPGPGGSCPHGCASSGSFFGPREGAQDAIPKQPTGIVCAAAVGGGLWGRRHRPCVEPPSKLNKPGH